MEAAIASTSPILSMLLRFENDEFPTELAPSQSTSVSGIAVRFIDFSDNDDAVIHAEWILGDVDCSLYIEGPLARTSAEELKNEASKVIASLVSASLTPDPRP